MKKLKMKATKGLTFEEGCNKYLDYCRQRNLRQGTIVIAISVCQPLTSCFLLFCNNILFLTPHIEITKYDMSFLSHRLSAIYGNILSRQVTSK